MPHNKATNNKLGEILRLSSDEEKEAMVRALVQETPELAEKFKSALEQGMEKYAGSNKPKKELACAGAEESEEDHERNSLPKPVVVEIDSCIHLYTYEVGDPVTHFLFEIEVARYAEIDFTIDFTGSENCEIEDKGGLKKTTRIMPFERTKVARLVVCSESVGPWSYKLGYGWKAFPADEERLRPKMAIAEKKIALIQAKAEAQKLDSDSMDAWEVTEKCKEAGIESFVDSEFPPTTASLFDKNRPPREQCISWRRPCEFMKGPYDVFLDDVEPSDIRQGCLADCWFLCSLAAMAEFPDVVYNCFRSSSENNHKMLDEKRVLKANPYGIYEVRFCKNGQWVNVKIDDYFPCFPEATPVYSKGHGNELWVLLLEKAYAKLHGRYSQLRSGYEYEALMDMTGAPCEVFRFDEEHTRELLDSEKFFEMLLYWDWAGYLMTCSTAGEDKLSDASLAEWLERLHCADLLPKFEAAGKTIEDVPNLKEEDYKKMGLNDAQSATLVYGHTLKSWLEHLQMGDLLPLFQKAGKTLRDLKTMSSHDFEDMGIEEEDAATLFAEVSILGGAGLIPGHAYTLLRVERTRAGGEKLLQIRNPWGKFEWTGRFADDSACWTEELRKEVGAVDDPNDGIFWMCFDDFRNHFSGVNLCRVRHSTSPVPKWVEYRRKGYYTFKPDDKELGMVRAPIYSLTVTQRTHAMLAIHQEDERVITAKEYLDIGLTCLTRSADGQYQVVASSGSVVQRQAQIEVTMEKGQQYLLVPTSTGCRFMAQAMNPSAEQIELRRKVVELDVKGKEREVVKFTLEAEGACRELTRRFDNDMDGFLNEQEMGRLWHVLFGREMTDKDFQNIVNDDDIDVETGKDGKKNLVTGDGIVSWLFNMSKDMLWDCLKNAGYDNRLNLIGARSYVISCHSERVDRHMQPVHPRPGCDPTNTVQFTRYKKVFDVECAAIYREAMELPVTSNGTKTVYGDLKAIDFYSHACGRSAVSFAAHNTGKFDLQLTVDCSHSLNVISHRGSLVYTTVLKPNQKELMLHLIPSFQAQQSQEGVGAAAAAAAAPEATPKKNQKKGKKGKKEEATAEAAATPSQASGKSAAGDHDIAVHGSVPVWRWEYELKWEYILPPVDA